MNQNKLPKRKNNRIKDYDYSKEGYYFITICTKDKRKILSDVVNGSVKTDPYINLKLLGKIVEKELLEIENRLKTIKIHDYIIMPNHMHIIVEIYVGAGLDQPLHISNVIGLFKGGVSRKLGYSVWQRNYYEHIIRNEKEYLRIKEYIINNPVNWAKDEYF